MFSWKKKSLNFLSQGPGRLSEECKVLDGVTFFQKWCASFVFVFAPKNGKVFKDAKKPSSHKNK